MILGIELPPQFVAVGGIALLVMLAAQIALGMRWIKLKGKKHWKVHKYLAFAILAFGFFHALLGMVAVGVIQFG